MSDVYPSLTVKARWNKGPLREDIEASRHALQSQYTDENSLWEAYQLLLH